MSFSSKKIILIYILITSTLLSIDIKNKKTILNDYNYTYNIADIKMAKTSHNNWQKNGNYGYFTAIVYRDGLEHGYDLIRVLINKENTSKEGITNMLTIKDIQINTPGIAGYIENIQLNIINNKLSLGIDIRTRIEPNLIVKQILMIDLKGKVSNIIPFNSSANISEIFYRN